MSMKNSIDTIGNRTRDVPVCSPVPQPTAPPAACPKMDYSSINNRVLGRIFRPKWDKLTEDWRKLHNEELNDLYSSNNIVQIIKMRGMRSAGHVARTRKRCIQGFGGET
jgi:hypothetical protein